MRVEKKKKKTIRAFDFALNWRHRGFSKKKTKQKKGKKKFDAT